MFLSPIFSVVLCVIKKKSENLEEKLFEKKNTYKIRRNYKPNKYDTDHII